MFVNQKAVKQHVHARGKQLEAEAMEAVDRAVKTILECAIANARGFQRIRAFEIDAVLNRANR